MDKNQATGLMLISALLLAYLFFFKPQAEEQAQQAAKPAAAAAKPAAAPAPLDSVATVRLLGTFAAAAQGQEQSVELRNSKVSVALSTRGGRPQAVRLEGEKTFNGQPLYLLDKQSADIDVQVPTAEGRRVKLSSLYFRPSAVTPVTENGKPGQRVQLTAELAPGQQILQTYTLFDDSYQLGYNLKFQNLSGLVTAEPLTYTWLDRVRQTEQSAKQNRNHSTINYWSDSDLGSIAEASEKPEEQTATAPVQWIGHKHDFFTAGLIADKPFPSGKFNTNVKEGDSTFLKTMQSTLQIPAADVQSASGASFRYYFGPNSFRVLKDVAPYFERNVFLGWGVFRYVNRFLVIPVFNFLEQYISSYGLIIVLLVVFLKTLLWPLVYKSYLSQAKMRVLKPEIDAIKEKLGDDQMAVQQETMKLYQSTGSSPLAGCLPMLATLPILFALFQFFPNAIELRGESFLWAKDLSTYDAPIILPFTVPFLGNHISLFTVMMTISTLLMTWQSNQMNPAAMQGPMKMYSYLMPLIFFFVLNDFPAGLTWYYFVSNVVTFAQQAITRRFVDEDKLHAQLQANKEKNKDKKPAGFQARLADAMKAAQERETEARKGGAQAKKK
ncbi:membrane protein insertase YidC [Hymenobacter edaphi]|uniref:Membrane protein insertase YidC n=1 Tax=Hymenobacter edaphi TaxID=2211146 RepID=A0A328BF86_9BACT|nr:membrane protein insertase YidC [Hymenobacter edaphi]RAK65151.1 membrane protein insertase YidC [Hymenobacter edaphi]